MGDLDEGILKQVESLVNSTIETHLKSRDSMLVEMQKSMQAMMKEMQNLQASSADVRSAPPRGGRRLRVAKATPQSASSWRGAATKPKGPSGRLPTLKKSAARKTKSQTKSPGGVRLPKVAKGIDANRRFIRPVNAKSLPRVARLGDRKLYTKEACKARAEDYSTEAAEWTRCAVKYDECRSTVFAPLKYSTKDYKEPKDFRDEPDTELALEFVHGYHCTGTFTNFEGSSNIFFLKNPTDPDAPGEMVWYSSAVVIIYDPGSHTQRFFLAHDDDVTSLAVHPNGVVVATGQVGKKPPICIWDSGAAPWENTIPPEDGEEAPTYPSPPEQLCNLELHLRGIKSLEFSPDGKLLCSVGEDDYHTVAIWDWDDGQLLTSARGHNAPVYTCRFNPYQYLGIPDENEAQPGEAYGMDDTCYTLVSCGDRHIKFWVFHRVLDPELASGGGEKKKKKKKDPLELLKEDTGKKSMASRCSADKMWRLECQQGALGKLGELQNFNCLTFVDDSPPLKRRNDEGIVEEVGVHADGRQINDHTAGRIVAGTAKGDIYIFVQPRRPPSEEEDADEYIDAIDTAMEEQTVLEKWWECPDPDDEEVITERIHWTTAAKLVHNVPRNVRAGNQFCLKRKQQEALAEVMRRLKARPKDQALLQDQEALQYCGPVAHSNGVHALAYHRAANQVMSAGGEGKIVVWEIGMTEIYTVAGINGEERDSDGKHTLVPVEGKEIDLRTGRPLLDLKDPSQGYEEAMGKKHPKTTAKSLFWDTEDPERLMVAIGTNTNYILQMDSDTMQFDVLVTAHTGCVQGIGFHAQDGNLFITASEDKTLCIWSADKPSSDIGDFPERWCLNETKLPAPGLCCAWHPNGSMIAVGCTNGEFLVYEIGDGGKALRKPLKKIIQRQTGKVQKKSGKKMTAFQKKFLEQQAAKKTGKQKLFKEVEEISDIKFGPNGQFLACGSRDNFIHLYHVENKFRRIGICRGHSSYITHVDFSANGKMMQSNDGAYELLYWEIDPVERNGKQTFQVKQYTSSFAARDVTWDDWTCVLGWPVQGVWKKFSDGTDVNSAHCCNKKKYLVTGDDYFKINLYRYPCLKGAKHKEYTGHCSHVMNVRFLRNDSRVISAGGNDCSVFVWKHRYAVGSIVDGVELEEDDPEKIVVTTMEEIMAIEAAEIEECFKGKEAEEAEDAMRREGLDADYDLDALKPVQHPLPSPVGRFLFFV